ncbi:MAG: leucine-rich repeat domain-containing protein, partial [Thermoguttaceae bacterium]|nr:leucine-rich repeat domain-containing protein [Thermoguttaceae bacterium]
MFAANKQRRTFVLSAALALLIAAGLSPLSPLERAFAQYEGWSSGDDVFYGPVEDRGEYKLSDDGKVFERYYGSAETFTIPDGVDRIGAYAFYKCETLKTVVVSNSVTRLTVHAFANCSNLEKVVFSETRMWIEGGAFSGCRSLNSIEIAETHPSWRSVDGVVFYKKGKNLFIY